MLPTGMQLRLEGTDAFDAPLQVHARQGGERLRLPGRTHSHALKHVLQAFGVPPWQREQLPLLSDATGTLLAAGDLVLSAPLDGWLRTHRARLAWQSRAARDDARAVDGATAVPHRLP
jgi:tRNA(Ile)-lysidine synthase